MSSSPTHRSTRSLKLSEKGFANLNEAKRVDDFLSAPPQIGTADSPSADSPNTDLAMPDTDIAMKGRNKLK